MNPIVSVAAIATVWVAVCVAIAATSMRFVHFTTPIGTGNSVIMTVGILASSLARLRVARIRRGSRYDDFAYHLRLRWTKYETTAPSPPMITITGISGQMSDHAQFSSKPTTTRTIAISSSRSVQDFNGAAFIAMTIHSGTSDRPPRPLRPPRPRSSKHGGQSTPDHLESRR